MNNLMKVDESKAGLMSVNDELDVFDFKKELVSTYYGSDDASLMQKFMDSEPGDSVQNAFNIIIEELAKESDSLLGNSLIFTKNNDLHDATTVTVKRAEMLELLSKIITKKQSLAEKASNVDLNSPTFQMFQQICVDNLKAALISLNVDNEMSQLIVTNWGKSMKEWQKELSKRMAILEGQ